MIRYHNRDYVNFIGLCDIRPSQQERGIKEFSNHKDYTPGDVFGSNGTNQNQPRAVGEVGFIFGSNITEKAQ